jgi:hypothetical protein
MFFALICNVGPIRAQIKSENPYINILSNGDTAGFWPFSNNFTGESGTFIWDHNGEEDYYSNDGFNGIFNGFSYLEFFVYGVIGIAIVIFPKIWN